MKRLDVQFDVKAESRETLTFVLNDSCGCVVDFTCACNFATGIWKVWRPNGTSVFCGAIVYSCPRTSGTVTYALDALVAATGTATFACAIACDTVTVNGLVYTGVAGLKADNTEFSIDCSDCATATDFAASVTADTRTGITVPSFDQTACAVACVSTITSDSDGTLGNTICLLTSGCTVTLSAATLTGGAGDTAPANTGIWEGEVEYLNCACVIIRQSPSFTFFIRESF